MAVVGVGGFEHPTAFMFAGGIDDGFDFVNEFLFGPGRLAAFGEACEPAEGIGFGKLETVVEGAGDFHGALAAFGAGDGDAGALDVGLDAVVEVHTRSSGRA